MVRQDNKQDAICHVQMEKMKHNKTEVYIKNTL